MKSQLLTLLVFVLFTHLVVAQRGTQNATYKIGKIPQSENFKQLTPEEKRFDSLYSSFKPGFKDNRSRIYLEYYKNDVAEPGPDSLEKKGLPATCDCFTSNDTIFIRTGAGFFGGFGFNTTIIKNHFTSSFFEYIDDVKIYKKNLSDTAFSGFVMADSKLQELILEKTPGFNVGETLNGMLSLQTNNYFVNSQGDKPDRVFVKGKVIFTCKIRKKTAWDGLNIR